MGSKKEPTLQQEEPAGESRREKEEYDVYPTAVAYKIYRGVLRIHAVSALVTAHSSTPNAHGLDF